ncbi:hypothetical protein BSKO_12141 [Bryopsis sp. KO-2023]|nr:hypothetical protein BSKO_12141 [Bryopsis sp. KO-2023]
MPGKPTCGAANCSVSTTEKQGATLEHGVAKGKVGTKGVFLLELSHVLGIDEIKHDGGLYCVKDSKPTNQK